jgi:predicted O-methyltransferase YrrM
MPTLHPVRSYLEHYFHSTNKHGVHSPFVYDLVTNVFPESANLPAGDDIEQVRDELRKDNRVIQVNDLGAGSRVDSHSTRRISSIAHAALHSPKDCRLLFRLARKFKPSIIVELGTSFGVSTAYLAKACPTANVFTIEGCPNIHARAVRNFSYLGLHNIDAINGSFDEVLPELLSRLPRIGLLYIDGNHRSAPTLNYFNQCYERLTSDSIVIFDDIHWSKDMESAWNQLIDDERIIVSIDLFRFGLVFVKRNQAKEHFRIRV